MEKIFNASKYLSNDFLRLETFNSLFWILIACTVLMIVVIWCIFRNKSEKAKENFIVWFCFANIVIYFVYKFFLSKDASYAEDSVFGFNWFNELPLQLCNINLFLIPIGVKTRKRGIMGFSFIMSTFGATMALISPASGFSGFSLLLPRMIGYYATHFFILVASITMATFNIYRPEFKDLTKVGITLAVLSAAITGVNYLFRGLGLCSFTNYFYTVEPEGISILEFLWNIVRIPYFYLLPALPLFLVYILILCLGFYIPGKIKNRKKEELPETETVSACE